MNTNQTLENVTPAPVGSGHLVLPPKEREQKKWWAVTADDSVRLVTGYSCGPLNPDYWWCPEVGASVSEKHHLFATEAEALDNLILKMQRRREETEEIITALRLRRQNAGDVPRAEKKD